MRLRPSLPLGFFLTLSSLSAQAHENVIPRSCLVVGGSTPLEIVSQFSFTRDQLLAYKSAQLAAGQSSSDVCSEKDCGIVDDWAWAQKMAQAHCANGQLRGELASVLPHVQVPEYFYLNTDANGNGVRDHHDLYRFSDGLSGICVICPTTGTTGTAAPGKIQIRTP